MARVITLENKLEDDITPNVPDGAGTVIVRVEVDGEITEQYFMPTLETAEAKRTELEG